MSLDDQSSIGIVGGGAWGTALAITLQRPDREIVLWARESEVARDINERRENRIFLPGGEKQYAGPADAEIFVDLEGDDLPDHFEGNEADLTGLIVETLSLAIDPYPRAPGESLGELGSDGLDDEVNPFASLKKLKQDLDKG